MLERALDVRIEHRKALVHKLWRRHLFHVDRVVDEHRRVAIDESLQDTFLVRDKSYVSLDNCICFCGVESTIMAQIIVYSFYRMTDTRCMCLGVSNVRDIILHPDGLLDDLVTKMALFKLFLKLMTHHASLIV